MSVPDTLGSKVPSLIWFLTPLFPEFLGSAAVEAGLASPSEGLGCVGKASEICPQGALWTRARGTPAAAGLGGPPTRLIPTRWEWGTAIHPSPGEGEKNSRLQRHSQKCENNWKPGRDRQQPPRSDLCPSGDLVLHLVGVGCVSPASCGASGSSQAESAQIIPIKGQSHE